MLPVTGIGQDSHAFADIQQGAKPLVLGGINIPGEQGLAGNSDADVVLHALCNAISSISGTPFLGPATDAMCKQGITDSAIYLTTQLEQTGIRLEHIAVSLEARRPRLLPWIPTMRERMATITGLKSFQIGITATSGEGLSSCGRGEGIMATVQISAWRERADDTPLLILLTCPDQQCAEHIASGLVRQKLAACVQQTSIRSTYEWQQSLHTEPEILLLVKTRQHCYARLEKWVKREHPYAVPQILSLPIGAGLPAYLDWLCQQTSQHHNQ